MSIHKVKKEPLYTKKQGQYLSFIYYYTKINTVSPAQADLQKFFRVSPAAVHSMILQLEQKNLITRVPNRSRSITINIPQNKIPQLS